MGFLRPFEFACYDLLFLAKPLESVDQRIVLLEWDEKSIQNLQESIISDYSLDRLLNIVIKQNPRFIGLDIYRDIPVSTSITTQANNERAYQSLQKTFADYPYIVGIEKIVPPIVLSSEAFSENGKVAAADLPMDSDFRLRRAYIFPNVDEQGEAVDIPYIGVVLGYKYLEREGWNATNTEKGLKIFRENSQITLNPILKKSHLFPDIGRDFLINWRKTNEKDNFERISITDVFKDKLPGDIFRDRLVIIGNTTSYSGDIHNTTITRWSKFQLATNKAQWTNRVEIIAQVASSIISAAKENRTLISLFPTWLEITFNITSIFFIAILSQKCLNVQNSLSRIWLITLAYGVIFITMLILVSYFSTFIYGEWINVAPALIETFFCWIAINNYYQYKREQDDFNNLRFITEDLNHSLGNVLRNLASSSKNITKSGQEICQEIENDLEINGVYDLEVSETNFGSSLSKLFKSANGIERETSRIKSHKRRTSEFIKYTYSNKDTIAKTSNLNQIIKKTVDNFKIHYYYSYDIDVIEQYDNSIKDCKLYIESLEILVESLLDNAFFAVNPILNERENYVPQIKIKTLDNNQFIQIIIEDNGLGIPKQYQKRIYQPRVSFKDSRGSGIGLYLVSEIVKYWKGTLSLESEVNRGSRFILSLKKLNS